MILEDLGPSAKVEGLPIGDYLVEIIEPEDWTQEQYDQAGSLRFKYLRWPLQIIEPEKFQGRFVPHRTMYWASQEAIEGARRPYDPNMMTLRFMASAGLADRIQEGGDVVFQVKDKYMSPDDNGKLVPDMSKAVGHAFYVTYDDEIGRDGVTRRNVTKAWSLG